MAAAVAALSVVLGIPPTKVDDAGGAFFFRLRLSVRFLVVGGGLLLLVFDLLGTRVLLLDRLLLVADDNGDGHGAASVVVVIVLLLIVVLLVDGKVLELPCGNTDGGACTDEVTVGVVMVAY
jgi:hypothetical protein